MIALLYLIPVTLLSGFLFLLAFWWCVKNGQYEDLEGDRHRVLIPDDDVPLR